MHIILLGLIELHHRCLRAVSKPFMRCPLFPAIQARLMNPVIILASKDERVLFPNKTLPNTKTDIEASAPKVVSFRIGMEDIKCATLFQRLLRMTECRSQKLPELRVFHRVVLNRLAVRTVIVNIVRRIGKPHIRFTLTANLRNILRLS